MYLVCSIWYTMRWIYFSSNHPEKKRANARSISMRKGVREYICTIRYQKKSKDRIQFYASKMFDFFSTLYYIYIILY